MALTPENRAAYIRMGYDVDEGSINAVNQANTKVEASLAAVQKSTAGVAVAADQAGKSLKDNFSRAEATIKADQKAVDDLRKSLSDTAKEADNVSKASSTGSGGGLGGISGLRRTGSALSQLGLGEVGGAVSRIGDIQQVAKEVDVVAEAFKSLPPPLGAAAAAAGPLILVFGALTVAAKVFNDGLANADAQVKKSSDQISAYYQIIKDGTTDSINAQIKKLEADKAINDAELKYRQDNLKDMQDKNLAKARAETDFWAELSGELEQAGLRAGPLTEKIKELKDKAADADSKIKGLKNALADSAVAANDAAKAEERLALERLKAIDQSKAHQIELADLAANGTAEQAKKKVEDAKRTQAATADAYWKAQEEANNAAATAATARQSSQDKQYLAQLDETIAKGLTAAKGSREKAAAQEAQIIKDQITSPTYLQALDDAAKKAADFAAGLKKDYEDVASDLKDFENLLPQLEIKEQLKGFFDKVKKGAQDALKDSGIQQAEEDLQKQIEEALKRDERVAAVQQKFNDQTLRIETADKEARLSAFQKYEDTVQGIEQKSLEARADLQTKYADQLVDIARKAADDAAKALEGLEQKQADLRTSLGRDEAKAGRDAADKMLDIQIKSQREERTALEEHLQRVKEIRQGDYVQDQKDLLDRNFQAIYLRRLGQTQQIEQETTKFTTDQRKRQQTINDEGQDAQRQAQIARRERLIAFEQANADAKLAYQRERQAAAQARQIELRDAALARNRELEQQRIAKQRELQAASQNYQRELADLTAKLAREKATLSSAYDAELKLAALYGKARVEAEKKTQQALLDQANAYLRGLSGGAARPAGHGVMERAGGGYLGAGQMALVNERGSSGRESFNGVPLPGAGLFIPSQAGYVNPSGGAAGMTIHIPMTIIGATDPVATARAVDERVVMRLKQVMGK